MEAEIWCEDSKAIIDPKGAWLTNLSDTDGDVLFPRRTLGDNGAKKLRGGSHVCMPNFGPGGSSGLDQHGFGRMLPWNIIDRTESSLLLSLDSGEGDYVDMAALMTYQLADRALLVTLELTNNSDDELRVAPGFHPYLLASVEGSVIVDDTTYKTDELGEVVFIEGNEHELVTSAGTFHMRSDELTQWALWTDRLGQYVCLEPTLAGFSFRDSAAPSAKEILPPGASCQYGFSLAWHR